LMNVVCTEAVRILSSQAPPNFYVGPRLTHHPGPPTADFSSHKRTHLFIGAHNETLSVAAIS
jgi:hypothetical protein